MADLDNCADVNAGPHSVASQLSRHLSEPRPKDTRTIDQLPAYKGSRTPWTSWDHVADSM